MRRVSREGDQTALLLRVGLGAVWVCEGLVPNLLAPSPSLLVILSWSHIAPGEAMKWAHLLGAGEVLLGLLLIRGWLVRPLAALQSALLLVLTLAPGMSGSQFLLDPTAPLAKNVALILAGLCLLLLPGGRHGAPPKSWRTQAIPILLRLGLAFLWVYEGLILKFLLRDPASLVIVARTGMVPAHIPRFLDLLGGMEIALGLAMLIGLWVRELAVLQVALLTAFTAIVGWTSPGCLSDPLGGLVKNVAVIGCALALYWTEGGAFSADAWLARSPRSRRWGCRVALHGCYATSIAAAAIYGLQRQAAPTPTLEELLQKLQLDETSQAEDLSSLLRRQGGRLLPMAAPVCGLAWIVGGLTVLLGTRAMLRFDLWLEERARHLYGRALDRLPAEEGLVGRALQAVEGREAQHRKVLRDHLETMRRTSRRRR
jgi:uncharacterized membrane protein YphA (DoxX/SURF4 family)